MLSIEKLFSLLASLRLRSTYIHIQIVKLSIIIYTMPIIKYICHPLDVCVALGECGTNHVEVKLQQGLFYENMPLKTVAHVTEI